jgi:hypothetical protein
MAQPTDYFSEVSKTDLTRVVIALATEVFETRDRVSALERILAGQNIDLAPLDALVEPAVYDEDRLAERDAFVARVFSAMKSATADRSGIQESGKG